MFDDDQRDDDAQDDRATDQASDDQLEQAGDIVPPPGAALVVKPPEGV